METISLDLRGMPDWVLYEYLQSMGGQLQPDGWFVGQGWQAHLLRLPDHVVGPMVFVNYRVEFQGEPDPLKAAWARFELKILRPGG